jgi:hypothetical protein
MSKFSNCVLFGAVAFLTVAGAAQATELKKYDTPEAVVDAHVAFLNKCDLEGLMSQYPDEAEFHLPDGVVLKGPAAIRDLFEKGLCAPVADGGLAGLQIIPESTFTVGDTVNVMWRAEAPYLATPYKGSDAYVTKDGLMYAQVTTFKGADLDMKK